MYFWLAVYWIGAIAWGVGGFAWIQRGDWIPGVFSVLLGFFFIVAATVQGTFLALSKSSEDDGES